jgi:beta-lactamase class A
VGGRAPILFCSEAVRYDARAMPDLAALHEELLRIGGRYSGKWTYALTDLTTGENIGHDVDDVMPTASLIKVPVLCSLYQAAYEGRVSLEDRIRYGAEHQTIGSGILTLLSLGVEMSIRDAAVLMICVSDNVATNMCIDLIGKEYVNEQMRRLGLEQTTLKLRLGDGSQGLDPRHHHISTAREMTALLSMIGRHEAVSPEASEDMLRIMRRQQKRNGLSRLLPWNEMNRLQGMKDCWVAEKGGTYLFGVRTSGVVCKGTRGSFAMTTFCEQGTAPGSGNVAEGNIINGELGLAAWQALAS